MFKPARISPGVPALPAVDRNKVLVTAMNSDAGTPLPETSPTAKHKWSSSKKKIIRILSMIEMHLDPAPAIGRLAVDPVRILADQKAGEAGNALFIS
jgi:hypothetical protein